MFESPVEETLDVPDSFPYGRSSGEKRMDELSSTRTFAVPAFEIRQAGLGGQTAGGRNEGEESSLHGLHSDRTAPAGSKLLVFVVVPNTGIGVSADAIVPVGTDREWEAVGSARRCFGFEEPEGDGDIRFGDDLSGESSVIADVFRGTQCDGGLEAL